MYLNAQLIRYNLECKRGMCHRDNNSYKEQKTPEAINGFLSQRKHHVPEDGLQSFFSIILAKQLHDPFLCRLVIRYHSHRSKRENNHLNLKHINI